MSKVEIQNEIARIKQKMLNGDMTHAQRLELMIVLMELYKSAIHSIDSEFLK